MNWIKKNLVWIMLGGVVFLFLLNFSMVFFISDKETRGTFGDQFGAVNALFSGLAFAGLIYTIILQRRDLELQRNDLKLQREELTLNRKEMEEQTAEFEKQNETLRIQRFEHTFFNMLSQFQEVVNSLSLTYRRDGNVNKASGREVFKAAFMIALVHVEMHEGDKRTRSFYGMSNAIKAEKLAGYCKADIPTNFDHYFRLLYRILKFVRDTPLITNFDDEYEYTSMLRAMLSRYELVWLFYNGLSDYGMQKFKPLIERYAMLKSLRKDLLVEGVDVGDYDDSAYKKTTPSD